MMAWAGHDGIIGFLRANLALPPRHPVFASRPVCVSLIFKRRLPPVWEPSGSGTVPQNHNFSSALRWARLKPVGQGAASVGGCNPP